MYSHIANPNVHWGPYTLLGLACGSQPLEYVTFLLDNGANPNYRRDRVFGALATACYHQRFEVVRLLLERGANPNHNYRGDTPFHLSLRGESFNPHIARLLVRYGAAPTVTLEQARVLRPEALCLLACEFGFDVDARDQSGKTLFCHEVALLSREITAERLCRISTLSRLGAEISPALETLDEPVRALVQSCL